MLMEWHEVLQKSHKKKENRSEEINMKKEK